VILKLHGLLAHWDEISEAMVTWVISLIEWEETERNNLNSEAILPPTIL